MEPSHPAFRISQGREIKKEIVGTRPVLKLLFISGNPDDTVVRHGVLATDQAFLKKPFSADALARRMREVLDARKGGGGPSPLSPGSDA